MIRARVAGEGHLGRLVEFGCGTGFFTEVLVHKADTLQATDIAPTVLDAARQRVNASNVTFRIEDCQHTSFPDGAFDSAFMSLVLQFTVPERTLAEMHRILRPGGTLIMVNLDPRALKGLARLRSLIRVAYQGVAGYRIRPPKGLGRHVLTEAQLLDLLSRAGFQLGSSETIRDSSRSSNIPVEYVWATKA